MKKGTKTSSFGVSKREGHDSSQFYASKLYDGLLHSENSDFEDQSDKLDPSLFGPLLNFDDDKIQELLASSVHLIIYMFPVIKHSDLKENSSFLQRISVHFDFIRENLATGGRLVVILENKLVDEQQNEKYYPFHCVVNNQAKRTELLMRGEIILQTPPAESKQADFKIIEKECLQNFDSRYSKALIYSKQEYNRGKRKMKEDMQFTSSISRDLFLACTKSVWSEAISRSEIIEKLIELYSFVEDTILILSPTIELSIAKIRPKTLLLKYSI